MNRFKDEVAPATGKLRDNKGDSKMPLLVYKRNPSYWLVTFDNPPINLFDPEMAAGLQTLIERLEHDDQVKVVVFDSANPDFFISHIDLTRVAEFSLEPGPTGLAQWPDFARRLRQASFVTVGLVRGRARGVGSEFLQALDVRFASREKAILSQIEVGTGIIPGGGGLDPPTVTDRAGTRYGRHHRCGRLRCRDGGALWLDQPRDTGCGIGRVRGPIRQSRRDLRPEGHRRSQRDRQPASRSCKDG
jgi:hypothetical protein